MGSMAAAETRSSSWSMPASFFSALSRAEEAAPSRGPVLPVTTVPSGSSMAAAGHRRSFQRLHGRPVHPAAALGQSGLIHQQLQLVDLALDLCAILEVTQVLK